MCSKMADMMTDSPEMMGMCMKKMKRKRNDWPGRQDENDWEGWTIQRIES